MSSLLNRIINRSSRNVRNDIFSISNEEAGILLSSKKISKLTFEWLLNIMFNRRLLNEQKMIDISYNLFVDVIHYIDTISNIAYNIDNIDRYIQFIRAAMFYPSFIFNPDDTEIDIEYFQDISVIFNPLVNVKETEYAMTIIGDPLPQNCLFMFKDRRNRHDKDQIDKLRIIISFDITGKSIAYLFDLIYSDIAEEWWKNNEDIKQVQYLAWLIEETYNIRKFYHRFEYFNDTYKSIPIDIYREMFANIVDTYLSSENRTAIEIEDILIDIVKSFFLVNIHYKLTIPKRNMLVRIGLECISYFSTRLDRTTVLKFIGQCVNYLDYNTRSLKTILRSISNEEWIPDFKTNLLND